MIWNYGASALNCLIAPRQASSRIAPPAIGIWRAVSVADLHKTQNCVLIGWRECAEVSTMPPGYSSPKPPFLPPNPSPLRCPASIELRAPLRYTGTRLRPRDQGLPRPFTRLLKPLLIILNISKA